LGISAEDEAIVAAMNKSSEGAEEERRTLADLIMGKIAEKEARANGESMQEDEEEEGLPPLPKKVVEVYTDIGKILSRYTSGKLPKAFKVIPSLSNWEQVLYLTRPDLWTPQAMYAATRIFASNLNPKMAQRFYYLVLLDAVRADISEHKKLNYHYYISLKKAVYKPAAFFKGVLLPLCKEECTLREAAIVASVLQRVSIPVHHSAVAIHKLAQMTEYNGAASIFIKTLLNKKYALPVPVIASLVRHFASFINDDRDLPVLWHQALLVFVQRYKNEVKDEARESLRVVMKKHFHHKITPEIRRELFGAAAWKDERSAMTSMTNDNNTVV
jgi:essential nuclear protein 1